MSVAGRPDPDALLESLKREEARAGRGALRVFLGMSPGVGKTYAMLEAARRLHESGRDVIIGCVETHGRRETESLAAGLPLIPRRPVVHRGVTLSEMDLDAILARKPSLVLVDELAHTNAPGSRHPKRYQDVDELRAAGIDVLTTLNVQHVASRADTVREITGVTVTEIVPDSVLDDAEIEIVDLSPADLLKRLAEGKVYVPERAEAAGRNFLREGNLTALREMALRVAADQAGQDVREYMQARQVEGPWKTGHRLLVAVSPSPFSEQMVRWTRRLADSLDCPWIAAHVETSRTLDAEDQARLTRHLALARSLGAETRTTADEDVVRGLLRIARAQNVTQIVVGKPAGHFRGGALLRRLVRESGSIDLHVVRVETETPPARRPRFAWPAESVARQYLIAAGTVAALTLANLAVAQVAGPQSVALIFLVGVVLLAMRLDRGPVYLAATASALAWNLLFLPPRFTLYIQRFDDALMFAMYFVVAIAMGQLIARLRGRERMDRRREARASAMYLLTLELGDATTFEQIERVVREHLDREFRVKATVLLPDAAGVLRNDLPALEAGAAVWAFERNAEAGRHTDTLPTATALYLPLAMSGRVLGVLRLEGLERPPTVDQRNLLDQFVRHIALVLDRQRLREAEAQARIVAESERLGSALINSVSHEIRTPIAALQGSAEALALAEDPVLRRALCAEIAEASERLNRLVGNLLDMTRLQSGHLKPRLDWCVVNDVVRAALDRAANRLAGREVTTDIPRDLPLVRVDFVLLEQALANLLFNAALHTSPDTPIHVSASQVAGRIEIAVADRGPGLAPEAIERVFDKFYRAPGAVAGGIGLGLSIVRGFIEAQGGAVTAANRPGGGAVFTLALPPGDPPS